MPHRLSRRTLLTGLAAGIAAATIGGPARATALHAVSFPWMPWNAEPAGAEAVGGIATRIARRVFTACDLDVEMSILPWQRAHNEVRQGHSDLIWSLTRSPARDAYLAFSDPLWLSPNLIFVRGDENPTPWRDWEAMRGKRLGVVRGYHYGFEPDVLRRDGGIGIEAAGSDDALFSMLLSRRIDAFAMNWQVFRRCLLQRGLGSATVVGSGLAIPDVPYYIAASRRSPAGMAALPGLNRAIAALRKNGVLDTLLREGLDPAPPPGVAPSRIA